MDIRTATEDDIDDIIDVLQVSYGEFASGIGDAERIGWDHYYNVEIPDVRGRWSFTEHLVAVDDGRIVATATYIPDASVPEMNEDRWPAGYAAMRLLAVRPDSRRKKLGRALTEACLARARDASKDWFGLHTTHLMQVGRAMYERMGFERFPENDIPISETFTVIAYRLKLP